MASTPERIGRYRVREVIGAGGFATVYRATDERLDVDVAIKVLAENHSIDPDVRERFIEEGRRLRRVKGPGLLEVYDLGDTERAQPYLVLAWADRGDLARRVAERRGAGWEPSAVDVLGLARAMAVPLGVLHHSRLVHRDLTPGNLLLRSSGLAYGPDGSDRSGPPVLGPIGASPGALIGPDEQLVLADLGMSKDLARASGLTVAGGTSGFAPPEQRQAGRAVDARADIWAASALVVWLVTGGPPGDDGDWQARFQEARLPAALLAPVVQGLATEPDARPPTIRDWLGELERALASPLTGPASAAGEAGEAPVGRRRGTVVVAAVVAGLVVGAGLGAWGIGGGSAGPSVQVEDVGDGQVRSTISEGGVTAAIEGPAEVRAGQGVVLKGEVEGAEAWTWVAPNGELRSGAELRFDAVTAGRLTVRLLAVDDQGEVLEVRHVIRVVEG